MFREILEHPLQALVAAIVIIIALGSTGALGASPAAAEGVRLAHTSVVTHHDAYGTRELLNKGQLVEYWVTVTVKHSSLDSKKRQEMRKRITSILADLCEDGACTGTASTAKGREALASDFRREIEKLGIKPTSVTVTYRDQKRRLPSDSATGTTSKEIIPGPRI